MVKGNTCFGHGKTGKCIYCHQTINFNALKFDPCPYFNKRWPKAHIFYNDLYGGYVCHCNKSYTRDELVELSAWPTEDCPIRSVKPKCLKCSIDLCSWQDAYWGLDESMKELCIKCRGRKVV
jgi:hypothetical protein